MESWFSLDVSEAVDSSHRNDSNELVSGEPEGFPTVIQPGTFAVNGIPSSYQDWWLVRRGPVLIAIVSFVVLCNVALSQSPKMIEPDPYAYRASISALADGNVNLTTQQYMELSIKLSKTALGGGIMQWHQLGDGQWISEKNPGYPYLAVIFQKFGGLRITPLIFGTLGCLGLWFGALRWIGRWGAAFSVSLYCSASASMVFAWRESMPTFTDTSLLACGTGLLMWSVLSVEKTLRLRMGIGALAFFSFGLATFVRYSNVTVLAIALAFAAISCISTRWGLPKRVFLVWVFVVLACVGMLLWFNDTFYGSVFSTGYQNRYAGGEFTFSSIPTNVRAMPIRVIEAMPVFLVAIASVAYLIWDEWKERGTRTALNEDVGLTGSAAGIDNSGDESRANRVIDRWMFVFLVASWVSTWGLYLMFAANAKLSLGASLFGVGNYTFSRMFVPALAPIVLLAAWLLIRIPLGIAFLTLLVLLFFGIGDFIWVVNSPWAENPWFRVDTPAPTPPMPSPTP